MNLGQWSVRHIAAMWLTVLFVEGAILVVASYQSRDIRAAMRNTDRQFPTFVDSLTDTSSVGLTRNGPRPDLLLDSAKMMFGKVLADSGVQRTVAGAVNGMARAAAKLLLLAAVLFLPLPLIAAGVTLRWAWLRGRRDDLWASQSAA